MFAHCAASLRLAAGAMICNDSETSVTTSNKQMPQLILDGDAVARTYRSFGLVGTGNTLTVGDFVNNGTDNSYDGAGATKTLCLCKPTGLIVIFR